jgi:predicted SAM-dependent methyltransferase
MNNVLSRQSVEPARKVIVGAGNTFQAGWLSLKYRDLDIRYKSSWSRLFAPASIDALSMEHVLEHLTLPEARATARNVWEFLRREGYWRIAVPDGFHSFGNYFNWVAPDSKGERFLSMFRGADEPQHKLLWNYRTLSDFLTKHGFAVVLREWFDEQGYFHQTDWSDNEGKVWRRYGSNWSSFLSAFIGAPYTSLVVDAIKI